MDVFSIPIMLKPEARKTIQASMREGICLIRIPQPWPGRKKYLVSIVDRLYWYLLGKNQNPQLQTKTAELNQLYFRFQYKNVRYHRQFRRWGSCSALKNINLSHRLIGAPPDLADYVIIHELAHLKHLNHGKDFWELVKTTGFNPKIIRREIEIYGLSWQKSYYQWYQKLIRSVERYL